MEEKIYDLPQEYDLEHARREPDINFYIGITKRWQARRILELGCGTGRITIPVAASLSNSGLIVGLDNAATMLKAARRKTKAAARSISKRIRWVKGDLRHWTDKKSFDLVIAPCGTLCHLLSLEDQLLTWSTAFSNLKPGGRFVVDVGMPEISIYAESLQNPSRAFLEIDNDTTRTVSGRKKRLLRYKSIVYHAPEQRSSVRYLYDEFLNNKQSARFLSDYEHHVYYPRELELLFRMTGFVIEAIWGDYQEGKLQSNSRQLVMVGIKPT